jgi:hypothetical protein
MIAMASVTQHLFMKLVLPTYSYGLQYKVDVFAIWQTILSIGWKCTRLNLIEVGIMITKSRGLRTRILIFFALEPKIVPKLGNLRFGNSKIRKMG